MQTSCTTLFAFTVEMFILGGLNALLVRVEDLYFPLSGCPGTLSKDWTLRISTQYELFYHCSCRDSDHWHRGFVSFLDIQLPVHEILVLQKVLKKIWAITKLVTWHFNKNTLLILTIVWLLQVPAAEKSIWKIILKQWLRKYIYYLDTSYTGHSVKFFLSHL